MEPARVAAFETNGYDGTTCAEVWHSASLEGRVNSRKHDAAERRIEQHYHNKRPAFAFCAAGLRRIAVNPDDLRARRMLLAHGPRYLSQQQCIIYATASFLDVSLFIDVGVNYAECLLALPLYFQSPTIGFEANPELIPYIVKSLSYNEDLSNVRLVPLAVSDEPGELVFYVDEQWSGKSSGVPGVSVSSRTIKVQATTIDAQLVALGPQRTILAKIDVEGFEAKVLRGARGALSSCQNAVVLVEFDSKFLKKAGEQPETLFGNFQREFDVYELRREGMRRVSTYDELSRLSSGAVHTDLVLARFGEPAVASQFVEQIANRSIVELRSQLFDERAT